MPDLRGARWRLLSRFGFAALLQSIPTHRADGQAIPKPDYVTYLPRDIALPVQATAGNRLFHLFGDSTTPGYRDEAPRDGVDDARALWLRGIAVRFAPWMVRNSVDFPMNFRPFIEGGEASTLFIDAFDLSQARPRLLDTKTVDFGRLTGAACRATTAQAGDSTPDCRLVELVDRFAPAPPPAVSPPRPDLDVHYVMYFDFPGQDPASWNREFEGSVHGAIARKYVGYAKAFVHPFINEVKRPGFEPPRYELVLQYWFFYPYNDAGNVHPIVFIGGDNRGLQQLIAAPSRLGRASHGSYPFPGLYKDVGPQNTGELVGAPWDVFRRPPESTASEEHKIVRLDNPDRIEIVPDWEQVLPLVRVDPVARRQWAWLVLPIRFGYPATRSPFAGIVRYAETGNTSILAPSFNGGWNRAGAAAGYERYRPHRLASFFPASQQDNYWTGWGFFNFTLPTLVTLPPFDLVYRLVTAPIRARNRHAHPAFYGSEDVPFRFIGATVGVSSYTVPTEFLNLLAFPELSVPFLNQMSALAGTDSFTASVNAPAVERVSAPYYGISLFLGRRFVSENTLRHSTGAMRGDVAISSLPGLFPLTARLDMWEYTGSLRYNIAQGGLQPFVKAGYGRSWYRVTDARFNGQLLGNGG